MRCKLKVTKNIVILLSAVSFLIINFSFSIKNLILPISALILSIIFYWVLNLDLFDIYKIKNYGLILICGFFDLLLIKRFYLYFITSSKLNTLCEFINVDKQIILFISAAILLIFAFNIIYILGYSVMLLFKETENYRLCVTSKKKNLKVVYGSLTIIILIFGAFILSALSNVFVFSNGLLNTDGSVFHYVAFAMKNGQVPYRDTFDHKGPLLYFINYIGYIINPKNGIWYLEFMSIFATLFFVFKIANKFSNIFLSLIATVLVMTPLAATLEGGNLVEEYAMPFIAASIYIFVIYFYSENIKNYQLALCGFCGGCVLMLRPNMAVVWLVMPIAVVINELLIKKSKNIYRYFGYFILGVGVAILPFIIYFTANGAIKDFFNCYIKFNLMYSGEKYVTTFEAIKHFSGSMIFMLSVIILLLQIIAKKNTVFNTAYVIFLVMNILVMSMSGRLYAHYAMILIPATAYPISLLVSYVFSFKNKKNLIISLPIIISVVILFINTFNSCWIISYNKAIDGISGKSTVSYLRLVEHSANYIKENTEPNDKILVVGNENKIYTLSERLAASKYSYQHPIINVGEEIKKEFYTEIDKNPPKIIVMVSEVIGMKDYLKTNNYKEINKIGSHTFYEKE